MNEDQFDRHTEAERAPRWTQRDTEELRRLYKTDLTTKTIAAILGRTPHAVHVKAWKLGLRGKEAPNKIRLTNEQKEWLRKAFPHVRNEVCAIRLNISPRSVTRIARRMNLSKTPEFMHDCQRQTARAAKASHLANGTYPAKGVVNENLKKGASYRFQPGQPPRRRSN